MIVRVGVVPRRTVCDDFDRRFDNLSGRHHQSQVTKSLVVVLIGRRTRNAIGRLSVKP